MIDYILFDTELRDRFLAYLTAQGLPYSVRPDSMAGFVVSLADDLDDAVEAAIEDEYAALMTAQRDLIEGADGGDARSLMMVTVDLADGRPLDVRLPALYARRLHEHFSIDEIRDLVAVIAQCAIDPPSGPICSRQ